MTLRELIYKIWDKLGRDDEYQLIDNLFYPTMCEVWFLNNVDKEYIEKEEKRWMDLFVKDINKRCGIDISEYPYTLRQIYNEVSKIITKENIMDMILGKKK